MPDDVLGVASHEQPAQAAAPVGAANDEIGGPGCSLLDDAFASLRPERLDQARVHVDPGVASGGLGLVQDGLASTAQIVNQVLQSRLIDLRGNPRGLVDDMHQKQAGGKLSAEANGFGERPARGLAPIDRHENALVHTGVLTARMQLHLLSCAAARALQIRRSRKLAGANLTHRIRSSDFRVPPLEKVELRKWPTRIAPVYRSKRSYQRLLEAHVQELSELQDLLYACNRHALLVIFQAMDTAGKDGAIKHVMSGVNPQGCQVFSFKHPSAEELEHDFLWRATRSLPERGHIGIFNRSYYEEVLIVRVHPQILQGEHLPQVSPDSASLWFNRYRSIANLEAHLHANGTRIVKFFLHLSRAEQRKRLLERIDDPCKNWKFSLADVEERRFWNRYMQAYEEALSATSTADCPWYVVPADDKRNSRLIISSIIHDTLRSLRMAYPKLDGKQRRDLQRIRRQLAR